MLSHVSPCRFDRFRARIEYLFTAGSQDIDLRPPPVMTNASGD